MQDKNIAISELKKLSECKGKSVETQFNKPSVIRQPNAQRIPKPSVLGKPNPFSNSPEMRSFQTKQSELPKACVTSVPREKVGSNDMVHNYYLEKAKKSAQLQKDKEVNGKPSMIDPTRLPNTANGCKPKPRNWQASMSSRVSNKDVHLGEHRKQKPFLKFMTCKVYMQKVLYSANPDEVSLNTFKDPPIDLVFGSNQRVEFSRLFVLGGFQLESYSTLARERNLGILDHSNEQSLVQAGSKSCSFSKQVSLITERVELLFHLSHSNAEDNRIFKTYFNHKLELPISAIEIRNEVWACRENKSPGPDGFTFEFFRKFWDVLGKDFSLAIMWFFDHCSLAKGCLASGKASVLVNGSPTSEFQFHCGLKQGDPLAPYLFLLVMESLHYSFSRVVEAGFFKGISFNESVNISHLFYADDAVFIAIHGPSVQVRSPTPCSPWYSIVREIQNLKNKGVDLLSHCKKRVGNGMHTKFWHDIWIGDQKLCCVFPRLFALEEDKDCYVASKFHGSVDLSFRRAARGGVEAQQFAQLRDMLDTVILSNLEDRWRWDLNGVSLDRLPTRLNLIRRGVQVPSTACPICTSDPEDISHLLFRCPMASDIHRLICRWWGLPWSPLGSYAEWLSWFKDIRLGSKVKSILEGVCYVSWWCLWIYRNQLLFATVKPRKDVIFDDIITSSFTWCNARSKFSFSWDCWLQHPNLISL
ncbi:RNA-directed DNA polymerase, eukaryota [Tanacetum coccineum]